MTAESMRVNPDILKSTSLIRACNARLDSAFGRVNGRPRFQWMLTSEIFWERNIQGELKAVESPVYDAYGAPVVTLIRMQKVHHRQAMSDRLGAIGWCIGQWMLPELSEAAHKTAFQNDVPYDAGGRWVFVDGTLLPLNTSPIQDVTSIVIAHIHAALKTTLQDCVNEAVIEKEQRDKETYTLAHDMAKEELTAFGSKPGAKEDVCFMGGVSLPE